MDDPFHPPVAFLMFSAVHPRRVVLGFHEQDVGLTAHDGEQKCAAGA